VRIDLTALMARFWTEDKVTAYQTPVALNLSQTLDVCKQNKC
jgi:hypothetical protein